MTFDRKEYYKKHKSKYLASDKVCRITEKNKAYRKARQKQNPERQAFAAMKYRCNNPNWPTYDNWGGRGIKVLYKDFDEFIKDVGKRPSNKYTIDRIDNDGNYEPGNCKWSTWKEQRNNQRPCKPMSEETKRKISKTLKARAQNRNRD